MDVQSLNPFGVRVDGVDLVEVGRCGPEDRTARTLIELFAEHHLLVVPDQDLDTAAQITATELFGPVLDERGNGVRNTYVSNIRGGAVAPVGELRWHQDAPFIPDPFPAISLFGVEVGIGAAPTWFASNAAAYDALSPAARDQIEELHAVHTFDGSLRDSYTGVNHDGTGEEPSTTHPVVKRHESTGRRYLYVNGMMTRRVVELEEAASAELIESLLAVIYVPANVTVHEWRTGDFVIWDNLAVQHCRPDGAPEAVRDLRRTVVGGDRTAAQYAAFFRWLHQAA